MTITGEAFFGCKGLKKMIDTGNTAWVLMSAALVFFMTPGLAFFYGGMSRSKNVLGTIMQSFFMMGLIGVEFIVVGYTMAFGHDVHGVVGGFDKLGLYHVENAIMDGSHIPEMAFVAFQCMFAIITPALMSGAVVGRMRFAAFSLFALLWSIVIYNPMAHWIWGGGFLAQLGALDFAGGLVIHIVSGVSALVLCLLVGKRRGYGQLPMLPHHLPMTVLGASILWFGWFGFNAGSALGANVLAAEAVVTTQIATAGAVVSWVLCEWLHHGKPTVFGAASGCVAGLVAITPAAGYVGPMAALLLGTIGAPLCYVAVAIVKAKLGYDDSLDAFGIHGVGGTWGAIGTGLFASTSVNGEGANGLWYGDTHLLLAQLASVLVAYVWAIAGTFVIYKIVAFFMEVRVDGVAETAGIDISEHGESAYNVSEWKGSTAFYVDERHLL